MCGELQYLEGPQDIQETASPAREWRLFLAQGRQWDHTWVVPAEPGLEARTQVRAGLPVGANQVTLR